MRAVPAEATPTPKRKGGRRPGAGRPRTRLQNALDLSEREMLCVLRRSLAADIDNKKGPVAARAALIRQFREITAEIKAIDEAAAALDDDDDYDDDGSFDPDGI